MSGCQTRVQRREPCLGCLHTVNPPENNSMQKILAKAALIGATTFAALAPAHAALTATATSVVDSATGLEWLKVPLTTGMSYNAVLASSYVTSGGYALASEAQIHQLFADAGGIADSSIILRAANEQPAKDLITLFGGCTSSLVAVACGNTSQYWTSAMWGNGTHIALVDVFDSSNQGLLTTRWVQFGNPNASFRADVGAFLVRQASTVPEPATLALLGLAFAGAGFARRQRKA